MFVPNTISLWRLTAVSRTCCSLIFIRIPLNHCRSITTYPGGPVDVPVNAAAQRIGATSTQVVFLWVKAKGAVIVTYVVYFPCLLGDAHSMLIRTTTSKAHMEEYLAVADLRECRILALILISPLF